jgi:hypothetical protein
MGLLADAALRIAYTAKKTAKQRSATAPADSVSPTLIVTDQAVPAGEGPGVRDESTDAQ